jgi:hypothetical protein
MTTVTLQAIIITVETITISGLVSIEVEVQAVIDIEVMAVTVAVIEGVSVVVLLALIQRLFLRVGFAIMTVVTETYT